jgi:hypothetical protein
MAATTYRIRGIEPPDLGQYDPSTRKLYWSWVVELGIKAKGKEILAGLDKDGKALKPIAEETRKNRRSAMTPSGKGDPNAPALIPGWQKSRTYSLLAGRPLADHAQFYWRYDTWTGDSWGQVLAYQAAKGRDVIGISESGRAWVKVQSWARWEKWKAGNYRVAGKQSGQRKVAVPQYGRHNVQHAELGVSASGSSAASVTFLPGRSTGWSTPQERAAWRRETASARLPGRPANPKEMSPISGPGYNRIIAQTWGTPGRASTGRPGRHTPPLPPPPPRTPAAPPFANRIAAPLKPKPSVRPPKPAPPPKPLPGPAGPPVRDALVDQTRGKTQKGVQKALDAIAKVHGDGTLPKIPIEQTASTQKLGGFVYTIFGRPIKIEVSSKGDHPALTAIHEIGHFLDNSGIPNTQVGSRNYETTPVLKDWLEAVKKSQAVGELKAYVASGRLKGTRPDGTTYDYPTDTKYVGYLLQHNELWARSYAQYIAVKSGDKSLAAELKAIMDPAMAYNQRQWSDADFEPILKAIDAMFTKLGWIK